MKKYGAIGILVIITIGFGMFNVWKEANNVINSIGEEYINKLNKGNTK
ncbi:MULTISPECIES: hypothetical protein [Xenorhabdus]|nr:MULTISPECIES: hypothetical protein [Xenorhabdus]